jgi:hypothetical protein
MRSGQFPGVCKSSRVYCWCPGAAEMPVTAEFCNCQSQSNDLDSLIYPLQCFMRGLSVQLPEGPNTGSYCRSRGELEVGDQGQVVRGDQRCAATPKFGA